MLELNNQVKIHVKAKQFLEEELMNITFYQGVYSRRQSCFSGEEPRKPVGGATRATRRVQVSSRRTR